MVSVEQFLWRHPSTYWWTFTFADCLEEKSVAMKRAKPFFDLVARRTGLSRGGDSIEKTKGEYLSFWELQTRGAWHLHVLVSCFFDVNWLRPWMVKRGWGQQMRVEFVRVSHTMSSSEWSGGQAPGPHTSHGASKLGRYLTKYLTKSVDDVKGKKPFSGSYSAKAGTVKFSWLPEQNPYAYWFYWGRGVFFDLYGRPANFRDFRHVMRLGYEACDWVALDPWTEPPG